MVVAIAAEHRCDSHVSFAVTEATFGDVGATEADDELMSNSWVCL